MSEAVRVPGEAIASWWDESESKFGANSLASTSAVSLRATTRGKIQETLEDILLFLAMNSYRLPV
jgi:hypothetical protein